MRRRRPSGHGGWTLVELTIVMMLITILAGMAMAGYQTAIVRSREAVLKEDLFRMRDALDQYYADRGEYPSGLGSLVSDGYLRSIPDDPFTNSPDTWQTVLADLDPGNPLTQGIFDVKSGFEGTAIDGTPYTDW